MMELVPRMEATQKTVDRWKGKVFDVGKFDCIRLMVAHARHCGKRIKIPAYGDWASAADAMRQMGCRNIAQGMDKFFERIDPHRRLLGDFVEMPGNMTGFSGLAVDVGNGRALGFHEDIPHCDIIQPILVSGAWRIV